MTRIEYAEYLYDLFMKETEGQLHPAKARFKELHDKGELPLPFIIRELRLMGVEYTEYPITCPRTLQRATAHVLHSVATIMFRYHLSFDEAMDPKYHEERWALLVANGADEKHKEQLLGMTKAQLVGGVL
ncbi:hypothetical protein CPT_Magnus_009 [Klebsiella phage Magnus]|uniref:Uncharacterized protein n=2 Tax=Taipeivirus TaxID=2731621 RepID=A0A5Q2F7W7_9CAUD|nr:hypothetical protein HYP92_gp009 [Klebsiella phage Magnus]YP_009884705.1 hypothetical protein HYQ02_gp111 [Klebsiella phage UPM 2146]QEG07893.1 hypothetical protein CPT_Magnus_009 [Klebsiella phage Magnus]QGF20629.1 hypothetical protein [Klebsiella phage UPM 2146]